MSNIRHKGGGNKTAPPEWASLRLRDRIRPGVRVLFVGINPGIRSATVGHHFAGPSNRFWKLLYESGLVGEPIGFFIFPGHFERPTWQSVLEAMHTLADSLERRAA